MCFVTLRQGWLGLAEDTATTAVSAETGGESVQSQLAGAVTADPECKTDSAAGRAWSGLRKLPGDTGLGSHGGIMERGN